jgi:hypothetical protein
VDGGEGARVEQLVAHGAERRGRGRRSGGGPGEVHVGPRRRPPTAAAMPGTEERLTRPPALARAAGREPLPVRDVAREDAAARRRPADERDAGRENHVSWACRARRHTWTVAGSAWRARRHESAAGRRQEAIMKRERRAPAASAGAAKSHSARPLAWRK